MKPTTHRLAIAIVAGVLATAIRLPAAEVVDFFGYDDCIRLSNDSTEVVLCPAAGGRVLVYSLHGKNALYLDPAEKGCDLGTREKRRHVGW